MQLKGFSHLLLILLLIIGIGIGIYLVQNPAIFKPKASESPASTVPQTPPTLAFVFFGESNSGGLASNLDATEDENAPTSSVQILNNSQLLNNPPAAKFEDLHIGFNNRLDHDALPQNNSHGLELQLAKSVKAGDFPKNSQVYLVKTGQGGSTVGFWLSDYRSYWSKFLQRISAAKSALLNQPVQWVVWYSLGINDVIGNPQTPVDVYKSKTIKIIHNIKDQLPGVIIIMTQFQAQDALTSPGFIFDFTGYNTALAQIAASEPNVYVVDTTDSSLLPEDAAMHWDYAGFKTLGLKMVDITKNALQTVNTLSATPNPCILNTSQYCTSKLSWNFPGLSNLKITVRENPGSLLSYQIPNGSIDIPWISASGATFDAYSGDTLLRSVFITGSGSNTTPPSSPTQSMTASPNPCTIISGETCTSTISWSFPAGSDVIIRIKETPNSLFASGTSGFQTANWIRTTGATFQAYVNGSLVQELFVKGIESSSSPSASISTGDINQDGFINILDLNLLIMDYPSRNLRSDVDHDGDLDIFDVNLLIKNLVI